ncbi:hypothetical protein [Psychroserpens sp. MEBiC05023]
MAINQKYIILLLFSLLSCQENPNSNKVLAKEVSVPNFIIKIEISTDTEDDFKIMFNNIIIDEFQSKNVQVKERIPTSTGYESIVASYYGNNTSNDLRIILGIKSKKVKFKKIDISYVDKNLVIDNDNFNNYFRFNEFISLDDTTFTFTVTNPSNNHTPVIFAKKRLIDFMFD